MITSAARASVIAALNAGATCQAAADTAGVSLTTAWKIARAEGIARRSWGGHNRTPPAKRDRIAERLRDGEKWAAIEVGERVSSHTVWRIGVAAGIASRREVRT